MPGFVKTPRDEARWAKAKEAAGKETEKDSESYYKLSNYIYHKMGKTQEDQHMAEIYKSEIANSFVSGKEININNINNIRHLLQSDMDSQQSLNSNGVEHMSGTKVYTAKQAAVAVLQKAQELLKKAEKEHKHIGWDKLHSKLEGEGYSKESADKIAGSIKAKVQKAEDESMAGNKKAPSDPQHPKEAKVQPQAGESEKPGNRIHSQPAPQNNPKEQAEGNNELAGTTPTQVGADGKNKPGYDEMKSTLKLAKFIGHMQAKRKLVKSPGVI